ncbi:poly(A)-specific ribonuclease PNLDC1-like [Protopterus annectens]|uniref:poly(A)-specific ribonuclease PNLDC1-like n=1 Tax=Protopterus annectens TaxID=7888 RepID=UPI001CFA9945|nr:poly(A)-specific ribonuclease PNLDC1-like [Protopterus annectens]
MPIDPIPNFKREIDNFLELAVSEGIISDTVKSQLMVQDPQQQILYLLPKIRKCLNKPPGRPIVSGECYWQLKGTTMGASFAPIYADLFMGYIEEKLIYDQTHNIYLEELDIWRHYLDDCCLFDSIEERYMKLRSSVQKFTVSQIGVSVFKKKNGVPNRFVSQCYNFYLFPVCFAQIDTEFSVQASSSAFLSSYGFDFNKLFKKGIPYLNDVQEAALQNKLATGVFAIYRLLSGDQLKSFINVVTEWIVTAEEGSSIVLSGLSGLQVYDLQIILRRAIPTVWTELKSTTEVAVYKVSVEKRKILETSADCTLIEKAVNFARGFTNLFRILVEAHKPLVGHNLFLDLLYLHEKFYRPLPESYSEFKNNICCLFPCVIDTKIIARVTWKEYSFPRAGTLLQISEIMSSKLADEQMNPPEICHADECQLYVDHEYPHEAAYDAFLSGSALLKMTYLLLLKKDL